MQETRWKQQWFVVYGRGYRFRLWGVSVVKEDVYVRWQELVYTLGGGVKGLYICFDSKVVTGVV